MDDVTALARNPFHSGERAIHARLGIEARILEIGRRGIRDHMPDQHRRFYEQLPFILAGSVDAVDRPWASMLVGEPGFVRAPDPRRLELAARPIPGDPLAGSLAVGASLGFLGIELHTRRRNRINGRIAALGEGGFAVAVEQSFGNCPQYIQGREYEFVRDAQDQRPRARQSLEVLDDEARVQIARADTLFVASRAPASEDGAAGGVDVSHRGGRAGFVRVEDSRTLLVPDFTGNFFFMTLGNLLLDPRAGLLFVDFETGDLLTLTGRTEIVWEGDELAGFQGAERAWRFRIEAGWRLRDALPLRWRFRDWSPNSLLTGTWQEAAGRREAERLADTWRPYRVARIVDESRVIRSFHLEPADGRAPPPFEAGQYLPIRLRVPGRERPLQRNYTISVAPSDPGLRISVKREGLASTWLHEHVRVGDLLEALGPRGRFTIDASSRRSAVLVAAGVGVTPMIAFARHVVAEGFRRRRTRPVHFIQVAHDRSVRALGDELEELARQAQGALQVHLVLSDPAPPPLSREGEGARPDTSGASAPARQGPLTIEMLKSLLPFDDHEFFLCGPGALMQSLYDGLRQLGVRDEAIHAEAFGPASLKRRADVAPGALAEGSKPSASDGSRVTSDPQAEVLFARSGESAAWTAVHRSLLELAESRGIPAPFSCRAGECGSCSTRLLAGRVAYAVPPDWQPAEGEALLCCSVPAPGSTFVELDL